MVYYTYEYSSRVGRASLSWWGPIELWDIELDAPDGQPFAGDPRGVPLAIASRHHGGTACQHSGFVVPASRCLKACAGRKRLGQIGLLRPGRLEVTKRRPVTPAPS